jgi:hypothetical protein
MGRALEDGVSQKTCQMEIVTRLSWNRAKEHIGRQVV